MELVLSANGSTPELIAKSERLTMGVLNGTWGGGTLTLEIEVNGSWVTLLDAQDQITYTADFWSPFIMGGGLKFRWTLSGATSPAIRIKIPGELVDFNS